MLRASSRKLGGHGAIGVKVIPPFVRTVMFAFTDLGYSLYRLGEVMEFNTNQYLIPRHVNVQLFGAILPDYTSAAFIAPNALIQGNVQLGHHASVYYHAIIRNFNAHVPTIVGDHSTIQDRVTFMGQVRIGHSSYVGAGTTLDCCTIHDNVYIGPGCAICLGAEIETGAIIAAGSTVPQDVRIPAGEIWAGRPAEKVGNVSEAQANEVSHIVHDQADIAVKHNTSVKAVYEFNANLDTKWFNKVIEMMEAQQKSVSVSTPTPDLPVEALRFMEPRTTSRRLDALRGHPRNNVAPWLPL